MKNLFLAAFAFLTINNALVAQTVTTVDKTKGKVLMIKNFESKHVVARNVEIYLPPNYDENAKEPYNVLYMQDGQNVFNPETAWTKIDWGVDEMLDSLITHGIVKKTIVVAPWNTYSTRFIEYMPAAPKEATDNDEARKALKENFGGEKLLSDEYLRFLVEELKPYIDKTYNVSTKPEDTSIAGSSMGGLISLYAISKYPEIYGSAGCVSTHWPIPNIVPAYMATLPSTLPNPKNHRIYFDYGTKTLDSLYEPHQIKVDQIMRDKGYVEGKNWVTKKFEGAGHDEKSWNARAHIILEFLLK